MKNQELDNVIENIEEYKQRDIFPALRDNIDIEIYKKLPKEIKNDNTVKRDINNEVSQRLEDFDRELKPKALYYDLKSKLEINGEMTEKDLTNSAYDFLEKNTNNKILKKIIRELKKENRK
ncbi:TPA: hypothetical protein QFK10_002385 [Enterococcus faecium]|uniref:hypothetical protein n=1 Tax=Enterococcus TaxID=1350 RepID=UPI00069DDB7B|nr:MULTISPECIES: hypothetical protein [Enterococcus]AKX85925.1 hypothetical protein LIANG_06810 [Enterococcus durans]AKZ47305.1 hypothetical protein LIU_01735 [Enterococcus durans]MBE9884645.1 hypothetical protein [Enterococcus faecium]MCU1961792.1 hypothetical protein [Enterococcus faecium]MDK4459939.1 hypothetical protein [Enterococcus faecium]